MRRTLMLIGALLVFAACDQKLSYPLQICSQWEDSSCSAGFECIGYHCIQACRYEGDCDLGFRCVNDQCLQSCDDNDDCTIGACDAISDDRPGNACALRDLPDCAIDDHCGWGICDDGNCLGRCDWAGACGQSQLCDFRRGDYGACVTDPDYEPPPPPATCQEAAFPDDWCRQQTGRNSYCDATVCRDRYAAVLVLDETLEQVCTPDDPSPATDLLGVRINGDAGAYVTVNAFGIGEGNENTDVLVLETVSEPSSCDAGWLSLGCGGGIVFIAGSGVIYPGDVVEVYTRQNYCDANDTSFANVYLCGEYPADLDTARDWCDVYLGPADDQYFTIPQ